jgi:small subunit ribosomal protein S7
MPRRKIKIEKKEVSPDPFYNSIYVSKFINYIMKDGKKTLAQKIMYKAMEKIKEKTGKDPLEVFTIALKNCYPLMEVRARRVGGATYLVPREVRNKRKFFLASKWIIEAARARKGKPMFEKLAEEIINAYNQEGEAYKKRKELEKLAEANKAFAHFNW